MAETSTTIMPFSTEREASAASLWAQLGKPGDFMNKSDITDLGMGLAGVELGAYDKRILAWLAGLRAVYRGCHLRSDPARKVGRPARGRAHDPANHETGGSRHPGCT